jgi:hypothetical protein
MFHSADHRRTRAAYRKIVLSSITVDVVAQIVFDAGIFTMVSGNPRSAPEARTSPANGGITAVMLVAARMAQYLSGTNFRPLSVA